MISSKAAILACVALAAPSIARAQNPMMAAVKAHHDMVKGYLLKTASLVPENLYAFKATPDVRSIAQLIGHVADASMTICGAASGETPKPLNAEKTLTAKADLSKALADAMAFCDKVVANMDDRKGMETTKFFIGGTSPRAIVLAFNNAHNFEHYGNLVTYMRLNKIVPPSTAGSGGN
jgi:uncharacterized damage-inducible protein DinB